MVDREVFYLDIGLFDESEVNVHFEIVLNFLEFMDEVITCNFGGKIKEGVITVAVTKGSRNVEENDDATVVFVHVFDDLALKVDEGGTD